MDICRRISLFSGLIVVLLSIPTRAQLDNPAVSDRLRTRLEVAAGEGDIVVGDERIHTETAVARFYEARGYLPAWTEGGRIRPIVDSLLAAVRRSDREGLRPGDYHLTRIERVIEQHERQVASGPPGSGLLVDLDLLCTDAFLLQAAHRLSGRVDPETIDPEWIANRRSQDLVPALDRAVSEGGIARALEEFLPPQEEYRQLRQQLERYRRIDVSGGWPAIASGEKMESGSEGERVGRLVERLRREDYPVAGEDTVANVFDDSVAEAVRMFQRDHGLDVDGVVGPATLRALNIPAGARARQISLNMERWRWLPQDLGDRYVVVNIAGFWLDVIEDGARTLSMPVIVGRSYRRTPVFSDEISYLVFNPSWNVPTSIATRDILPEVKRDPTYLSGQNMTLLSGWGADARVVDPVTVDWSTVTETSFPFRVRQEPGPNNALGTVKFMFPNEFNVYLHDTPARGLFSRSVRTFSSGCIRVERPHELAAYLLRDQPDWSIDRIRRIAGDRQERSVRLTEPVPVHLLYWTAWVDEDGSVEFRDDIYGRDIRLDAALQAEPPAPAGP